MTWSALPGILRSWLAGRWPRARRRGHPKSTDFENEQVIIDRPIGGGGGVRCGKGEQRGSLREEEGPAQIMRSSL